MEDRDGVFGPERGLMSFHSERTYVKLPPENSVAITVGAHGDRRRSWPSVAVYGG
ncbi:hypothetical protein JCM17823_25700 [Halorubrum gandharaense]